MHTDHYFEIGSTHSVCEDYALSEVRGEGSSEWAWAAVADGCSSSGKHGPVDLGARIILYSFRGYINLCYPYNFQKEWESGEVLETQKKMIMAGIDNLTKGRLCLPECTFDATLVFAASDGKRHQICFFGDGHAIIKYKDGTEKFIGVEYETNAPFYLSYDYFYERRKNYDEFFPNSTLSRNISVYNPDTIVSDVTETFPATEHMLYYFEDENVESISVLSDGVQTYDRGEIDLNPYEECTSFKNYKGEFVKRRMMAFRRKCLAEKIKHTDDVSISTIYFNEEEEK
jgi:hypothetical protein